MLQRIGKYEILEQIGRGGQGTVYRARDTGLDRIVAIKVIDQSVADDPGYLDALRREAQLAASLDHPNIVTVHAFELENDTAYIVMEYVPDALDRQIRSGRLEPRRAVSVAEQVCRALAHAHESGIVHRDIKPPNILLAANGDAKISDFGISRAIASSTRAHRTSLAGTYQYLPPEQWEERPAVDRRSDIYSVGVTLFEMLAGTIPFTGNSVMELHRKHHEDPVPPLPRNIRTPSGLVDVIQKAMAKRPELRFQTAGDMADELAELFRASGGGRKTPSASPPISPPRRPVASGSGSGRTGGISSWLLFGGSGAIVMAVIAIVIAIAVGGNGDKNLERVQVAMATTTPTPTETQIPPSSTNATLPTPTPSHRAPLPTFDASVLIPSFQRFIDQLPEQMPVVPTTTPVATIETHAISPTPTITLAAPEITSLIPWNGSSPGEQVIVKGMKGYYLENGSCCADQTALVFPLYISGIEVGYLSCSFGHCEGTLDVPSDISLGVHQVKAQNGPPKEYEIVAKSIPPTKTPIPYIPFVALPTWLPFPTAVPTPTATPSPTPTFTPRPPTPIPGPTDDHGYNENTATRVSVPVTITGTLSYPGDEDFFLIKTSAWTRYHVKVSNTDQPGAPFLTMIGVRQNVRDQGGDGEMSWYATSERDLYVAIGCYYYDPCGFTGGYELTIESTFEPNFLTPTP